MDDEAVRATIQEIKQEPHSSNRTNSQIVELVMNRLYGQQNTSKMSKTGRENRKRKVRLILKGYLQ